MRASFVLQGERCGPVSDPRDSGSWADLEAPPLLLVVSGPSGAGKTTLCRRLIDRASSGETAPGIAFSVSTTTRDPREGERDGHDYHFVDESTFQEMVDGDEFLEWAEVHGERYGTSRQAVQRQMREGKDVILDIDVQGGRQVRRSSREAVLVFVLPPSFEELEHRLSERGTESRRTRRQRIENARREIEELERYDYLVVNDDLERAVRRLGAIRIAEKSRVDRLPEVLPQDRD